MPAPFGGRPFKAYHQITALSSAVGIASGLSGGIPEGTVGALIQAETSDVRWRADGTNPTGSVGMIMKINEVYNLDVNLDKLRFIETAINAKLNIQFYGGRSV